MKRVQRLERAQEVIFVDTTSSVENNQSSMTIMLCATKIGALPVAAFLHESQSTTGYVAAMNLLKENFANCFGGKDVIISNFFLHLKILIFVQFSNKLNFFFEVPYGVSNR